MVRFHGLFIGVDGLIQSQLIQHTYTDFVLKLIVDRNLYRPLIEENKIKKRLKSQVGEVKVDFEYVDTLPVNGNGKVKSVISLVR